jgi:hypothetical protein
MEGKLRATVKAELNSFRENPSHFSVNFNQKALETILTQIAITVDKKEVDPLFLDFLCVAYGVHHSIEWFDKTLGLPTCLHLSRQTLKRFLVIQTQEDLENDVEGEESTVKQWTEIARQAKGLFADPHVKMLWNLL